MAELADVRLALCNLALAAAYPNGTSQPTAIPGLHAGCVLAIFPDWPKPGDVDSRLAVGDVLLAVTQFDAGHSTTRFPLSWSQTSANPTTVTATVSGATVMLGGTVSSPQNVGVQVNGQTAYSYQIQQTDTLPSIATGLANLISADWPVTIAGSGFTVHGAARLVAKVGAWQSVALPTSQQMARYRLTIWAQTDAMRAAAVRTIKPALDVTKRARMPDGTGMQLSSGAAHEVDDPDKLGMRRTDILFAVEWSSAMTATVPTVVAATATMGFLVPADDPAAAPVLGGVNLALGNAEVAARATYAQLPAEVQALPLAFIIPGQPITGLTLNLVMGMPVTIPAAFFGTVFYAASVASSPVTLTVNRISAVDNSLTTIGTVTVQAGSHTRLVLAAASAVNLNTNDVLQVVFPQNADASMADACLTFLANKV